VASSIETKPAGGETVSSEPAKESFWTGGRVAVTVIIVGLIIWYGVARYGSRNVSPTPGVSTAVTKPPAVSNGEAPAAPPAFIAIPPEIRETSVKTLDGDTLKLSDFAGKVVILNVWAVWCGPCRTEMPELVKMSSEYKSRGLVVVGIASAFQENETQVRDFVQKEKIPYKVVFDDGSLEAPLVQLTNARSVIPQSFVISRDGKIVKHFTGFNALQTPQLMRQAIEEALGDKGKAQ
jgi:peroxiredoxin